jgi:DNA-binding transcriptional regulator YbjK
MSAHGRIARQPRGLERRREVLEATLRVIGRSGIRAATHRAVAEEAGTSLSATTYYFASGQDMIGQAFAHYVDERIAELDRILAEVRSRALAPGGDALGTGLAEEVLTAFVLDELSVGRLRISAEYQLALEGMREPEIAAQFERLSRTLELHLVELLALIRTPSPRADARLVLAFVRGLELDEVTRQVPSAPAELRVLCQRFAAALSAPGSQEQVRERTARGTPPA